MRVFVDTSALFAYLDGSDVHHASAKTAWTDLLREGDRLVTSNYLLAEAVSVVQKRLGMTAVRGLVEVLVPPLDVEWVTPEEHAVSLALLVAKNRSSLSLVDLTSFEVMKRLGMSRAFTFDAHFQEHGFEMFPGDGA